MSEETLCALTTTGEAECLPESIDFIDIYGLFSGVPLP